MSEPHLLTHATSADLAELAGLLVEQEAAHRRARAGQDIALYTPGGDGHPAFEAACADMLSREEDATVADRAVVEMTRRIAARPAPVDAPTSTAPSDFDALAGRIEAMADKLHRESRGDCRERDIARALSGMVYSARRGRLKPAPVEPDGLPSDEELLEASGRGWAEATLDGGDQEARANRAVATLAATRARAAWEAERASLVAVIDAERGYGHGMTPADAVRDLGRMYRDLSQRYMALDATWGEAEDECKGLRASVVQGAEREAFLASSLRDGIAERARLTAQVESLTAELGAAMRSIEEVDSTVAKYVNRDTARERDEARAEAERLTARLAVPEDAEPIAYCVYFNHDGDDGKPERAGLHFYRREADSNAAFVGHGAYVTALVSYDAFAALRERAEMAERERGAKVLTVERLAEAMRSHDNERGGPYDESEAAGLFRHLGGPVVVPDRAEELARAMCDVTYERRGSSDFLLIPWSRTNAEQRAGAIDTARAAIARLASLPAQPAPTPAFGRVTRTVAPPVVLVDDEPAPTHDAAWQAEARRLVDGVEQAAALRRRHPQMGDADTGGLTAARSALLRHLGIPEQAEGDGGGK